MATDDFCFVALTRELGLIPYMNQLYTRHSGRWIIHFLVSLVARASIDNGQLIWYSLATFVLLSVSVFCFLSTILRRFIPRSALIVVTPICLWMLFISVPVNQTWFWLTGSFTCLWTLSAALLAFAIAMRFPRNLWALFLSVCLAILSVNGYETFTMTILLILSGWALVLFLNAPSLSVIWSQPKTRAFLVVFFVIVVASAAGLFAPGNFGRRAILNPNRVFSLQAVAYHGARILFYSLKNNFLAFISFFLVWLSLGGTAKHSPQRRDAPQGKVPPLKAFIAGIVFLLAVSGVISVIGNFAMQGGPSPRSQTPLIIVELGLIGTLGFILGSYDRHRLPNTRYFLTSMMMLFLLARFGFTARERVSQSRAYAVSFDERLTQIKQGRLNSESVLSLAPLPNSGWIESAEIFPDSKGWKNICLARAYGLFAGASLALRRDSGDN